MLVRHGRRGLCNGLQLTYRDPWLVRSKSLSEARVQILDRFTMERYRT
jgi:hypothetical protein